MSRRRGRVEDLEIDDGRRRQRRRRAILPPDVSADDKYSDPGEDSTIVMVNGLDPDSTVLDLKSRMEMYGSVARIRIDSREGVGYVRYRTPDQALSAIAASENHLPSVTFGNPKVPVNQENEIAPQGQPSTGFPGQSNLLRSELPLRRRGRGNKLINEGRLTFDNSESNMQFNGREIVAYDDIL